MKIAKFAESDRGKKISQTLVKKGRLVGYFTVQFLLISFFIVMFCCSLLFYCAGIGVYCMFPVEGYHRKKFFDENALLTGLVKREFRDSSLITSLQSQYRQNKDKERYQRVKSESEEVPNVHVWL